MTESLSMLDVQVRRYVAIPAMIGALALAGACGGGGRTIVSRFPAPAADGPTGRVGLTFQPPMSGCAIEVGGHKVLDGKMPAVENLILFKVPVGPVPVVICPSGPNPTERTLEVTSRGVTKWPVDSTTLSGATFDLPANLQSGLSINTGLGFRTAGLGVSVGWDQRVQRATLSAWTGFGYFPASEVGGAYGAAGGIAAELGTTHRLGVDLGFGVLGRRALRVGNAILNRETAYGPAATIYYRAVADSGLSFMAGVGSGVHGGDTVMTLNLLLGYVVGFR